MSTESSKRRPPVRSQRPRATTVFAAAFLAGAAAAVGLNRSLDVHLAQRQPRVESEPIFVTLRSLPQGSPITVWDVALRDWPKAMLPAAALRPRDSFDGMVLRHAVREGQPLLSVQLAKADSATDEQVANAAVAAETPVPNDPALPPPDLWAPAEVAPPNAAAAVAGPQPEPTLAEQVPVEPIVAAPLQPERTVLESVQPAPVIDSPVIVATTSSTDIDPAIATVTTAEAGAEGVEQVQDLPRSGPRYLVVPERIALEADRSFVPVREPAPPATPAAESTATAASTRKRDTSIEQGRSATPTERTSSNRDRQTQRPPRSASSRPAPAAAQGTGSWSLRSLLPGLSPSMGAVDAKPSPNTARPDRSAQATEPPTARPAARGFFLFR
ncbi:MAG: hypothetical protein EBS56_00745 [Planctomycetia bacterium]|nr:hypothetical protein [Planctomycetia bacterium]